MRWKTGIIENRDKAQHRLGDRFSLRDYHNVC